MFQVQLYFKVYQLPDCDSDEDEDFKQQDKELKSCLPFAVVGSNTILEVNGKKMRGRQYDWGLVEGTGFKLYSTLVGFTNIKYSERK